MTGETRIHDNQSHNLMFYPLNYGHMERLTGFEPATFWMAIRYSTNWATAAYGGLMSRCRPWHPIWLLSLYACGDWLIRHWCGLMGSNHWPHACKTRALTSWAKPAYGASSQTWTDGLTITSGVLYQLSYRSIWRRGWDSNPHTVTCDRFSRPEQCQLCLPLHIWRSDRDSNPD